jgi:hypothetical protein
MAEPAERVEVNADTRFETSDWPVRTVALVLLGVLIFLVAAPLLLIAAFPDAVSDVGRRLSVEPPAPRLQTDPAADLARFRAAEDKRLNTYYWIDKQNGIVHIPIARAMKELAAKGIPGFPKASP